MARAQKQLEPFANLVTMFLTRARENGAKPFLSAKRDGAWVSTSYAEAARQVAALADSLKRIGLKSGDRVMLVSENRPEWLIADLGIMAAGCVTVPTYTTNTTRDHAHVLVNSGARAAIALPVLYSPGDTLFIERGSAHEAMIPALTALGHARIQSRAPSFKANAIEYTGSRWVGAADPRSEGASVSE